MNYTGLFALFGFMFFSILMISIGMLGLKNKKLSIISTQPYVTVTYTKRQSIAPSIVFIYVGFIMPMIGISVLIDKMFIIDYSMPILLGISLIIALFSIFYLTNKNKK